MHRILSSGDYEVGLTEAGTGFSRYRGYALTRWRDDPIEDRFGWFVYLRDLETEAIWSAGREPVRAHAERSAFRGDAETIELEQRSHDIESLLAIALLPEGAGEIRRLVLRNDSARARRLDVTTYLEVALNTAAADAAHPAFSKLFVQTEHLPELRALLARRRPRGNDERHPWMVHALAGARAYEHETDRMRFLGRGGSMARPAAMASRAPLSGTAGNVLDPVMSIRATIDLAPGEDAQLAFLLGVADSRDGALAIARRFAGLGAVPRESRASALGPSEIRTHVSGAIRPRATEPPRPVPHDDGDLRFFNGLGGFTADGTEYVIRLRHDAETGLALPPLPWINVVANEGFGFLVSETGAGYTWGSNSREQRITEWSNDPVLDPHSEALYVRDEESGQFWSLLPGPCPVDADYEVRHGFGYSTFRSASADLEQEVVLFVHRERAVKIARARITNRAERPRRLSLFAYQRLVLGGLPEATRGLVATSYDDVSRALLARNDAGAMSRALAFAACVPSVPPRDGAPPMRFTVDRAAFIGSGTVAAPEAIAGGGDLDDSVRADLDPCFAQQLSIEVPAGGSIECTFLLGEAGDLDEVRALVAECGRAGAVEQALLDARARWREFLTRLQIATPDPALDLLVNGWLAYQDLSCRIWGRSAFYQSGGAFGYRDQLQDSAALALIAPERTRAQILLHAAHQFVEGDVLHWWHPPDDRGLRTRFADDLLWLPYVTADYIRATGDGSILDERAGFVTARALEPGEDEAYLATECADESADVYDHCCRALDRSLTKGSHGLPLFGSGDWNDAMNRVGREGRGESVWMGFFLYAIIGDFLPICETRADRARVERYSAYRDDLARALDSAGWDGEWYRRAYYDDGAPIGSSESDECRIDALAQAWAVISQAAPRARAHAAMDAVERHLVSDEHKLIRLLTPPFENTPRDPGYIKGYVPGVRENGGQYTHAALWVVKAMAELGRNDRAAELLAMLNPVNHARTPEEVATYRVEPYVVAADVYGEPPHVGRGGWTWYTGSAGWMYRVAVESILGLRMVGGDTFVIDPRIPGAWPGYRVHYRDARDGTRYDIEVARSGGGTSAPAPPSGPSSGMAATPPQGSSSRVAAAQIDGVPAPVGSGAARIPLARDGALHSIRVLLG